MQITSACNCKEGSVMLCVGLVPPTQIINVVSVDKRFTLGTFPSVE